jgi:hypothetical protein
VPDTVRTTHGISACVLLAGGLRLSPLAEAARCPTVELWLTSRQTVFGRWCDVLYDALGVEDLDLGERPRIDVVHSGSGFEPAKDLTDSRFVVTTRAEPGSFRGPAGVLRDVTQDLSADAGVLVAESARYIGGSIGLILDEWDKLRSDVLIACHPDGTPTGIMVMRRGALELVPDTGFMDTKEQWLPRVIKAGLRVWTTETREFRPYPLRTREQFLSASCVAAGLPCPEMHEESVLGPPRLLKGGYDRSRVSDRASIGAGAVISDAVVMPGAVIGSEAVVVRSIICPGGVVPAGAEVVEQVVPSAA